MSSQHTTFETTIAAAIAANNQLAIDRANAEAVKQAAIAVARDTLRNAMTGEVE
jgi:hypothetical protein